MLCMILVLEKECGSYYANLLDNTIGDNIKLSIFPKAKPHPENQREKSSEARFVSKPYMPEIVEFETEQDLIDVVCNNTWSPFLFKGYRKEVNFISTDVIAFDIDSGQTIEEAEAVVHKLDIACLCLPSTSHSDELHKFRLIFPLSKTITNVDDYKITYAVLAEHFNVDPACKDAARFYYGSKQIDGFFYESELLTPTTFQKPKTGEIKRFNHKDNVVVGEGLKGLVESLYGEPRDSIPDTVSYFLEHAANGMKGEMYVRGNSFLFTSALMGCEKDRIMVVFYELYPYKVDSKVEYMVNKIIDEGYEAREEM